MAWISLRTVQEKKDDKQKQKLILSAVLLFIIVFVLLSVVFRYKREYLFQEDKTNWVCRIISGNTTDYDSFVICRKQNHGHEAMYGVKIKTDNGYLNSYYFYENNVTIVTDNIVTPADCYISFESDGVLVGDEVTLHVPKDYIFVDDDEFFKEAILFDKESSMRVLRSFGLHVLNKANSKRWFMQR